MAVPVTIYLLTLWILHYLPRGEHLLRNLWAPVGAVLILLTPLTGGPVLLTGLILAALLTSKLVRTRRQVAK